MVWQNPKKVMDSTDARLQLSRNKLTPVDTIDLCEVI